MGHVKTLRGPAQYATRGRRAANPSAKPAAYQRGAFSSRPVIAVGGRFHVTERGRSAERRRGLLVVERPPPTP